MSNLEPLETEENFCRYHTHNEDVQYTYFIGGTEGPIKVGKSNNPFERIKALQSGSPIELFVYAITTEPEVNLHRILRESRQHGEWFDRDRAMVYATEYREKYPGGHPLANKACLKFLKPRGDQKAKGVEEEVSADGWYFGVFHVGWGNYAYGRQYVSEKTITSDAWTEELMGEDVEYMHRRLGLRCAYSKQIIEELVRNPFVLSIRWYWGELSVRLKESSFKWLDEGFQTLAAERNFRILTDMAEVKSRVDNRLVGRQLLPMSIGSRLDDQFRYLVNY